MLAYQDLLTWTSNGKLDTQGRGVSYSNKLHLWFHNRDLPKWQLRKMTPPQGKAGGELSQVPFASFLQKQYDLFTLKVNAEFVHLPSKNNYRICQFSEQLVTKSTNLKCENITCTLTKACCRRLDILVLHCELKQQHQMRNAGTEQRNCNVEYKNITHSVVYTDCWSPFWLEGWSEHPSSGRLCEQIAFLTSCLHEVCQLKIPVPCILTRTLHRHQACLENSHNAGKTGTIKFNTNS